MPTLLLTFLLIGVGWFLLIRPQQERAKAQRALVDALAVGDRVISAGGIHGTITAVADETIELEVAPGVVLTLARPAVARRVDEPVTDATDPPVPQPAEPAEDDVTHDDDGAPR